MKLSTGSPIAYLRTTCAMCRRHVTATALVVVLLASMSSAHGPAAAQAAQAAQAAPGNTSTTSGSSRPKCNIEDVKSKLASVRPAMANALMIIGLAIRSDNCPAVGNVLALLSRDKVTAGRKLEGERPFDPAAAAAELAAARADAEISAVIAAELAGESHELRRLLLEAAVMADFGKTLARDQLLMQLERAAGSAQ